MSTPINEPFFREVHREKGSPRFTPYSTKNPHRPFSKDSITPQKTFYENVKEYREKNGLSPTPKFVTDKKIKKFLDSLKID